jgi:hypothetical protein
MIPLSRLPSLLIKSWVEKILNMMKNVIKIDIQN